MHACLSVSIWHRYRMLSILHVPDVIINPDLYKPLQTLMQVDFLQQYKLGVFQFYHKYDRTLPKTSLLPVLPERTQGQRHTCFLDIIWDLWISICQNSLTKKMTWYIVDNIPSYVDKYRPFQEPVLDIWIPVRWNPLKQIVWLMVSVLLLTFLKGAVSGKQCSLNVDIRCFLYSNKAGENWT